MSMHAWGKGGDDGLDKWKLGEEIGLYNAVATEASTNPTGNCKAGWPFRESMIDLGSVTLTGGGG